MLRRYTPLKRTPIKRKPPKTRVVVRDDGREILHGQAWEERRKEAHDRAGGRCEGLIRKRRCFRSAPLHQERNSLGDIAVFSGEAHHKKRRGLGGATRDDRLKNLDWLCHFCHDSAHRPKKVVPKKERELGDR